MEALGSCAAECQTKRSDRHGGRRGRRVPCPRLILGLLALARCLPRALLLSVLCVFGANASLALASSSNTLPAPNPVASLLKITSPRKPLQKKGGSHANRHHLYPHPTRPLGQHDCLRRTDDVHIHVLRTCVHIRDLLGFCYRSLVIDLSCVSSSDHPADIVEPCPMRNPC